MEFQFETSRVKRIVAKLTQRQIRKLLKTKQIIYTPQKHTHKKNNKHIHTDAVNKLASFAFSLIKRNLKTSVNFKKKQTHTFTRIQGTIGNHLLKIGD